MNLTDFTNTPISFPILILNLSIGLFLSSIISWYYVRYGEALTNRTRLAQLLPVLTLIIILIISVVKSSLALSLGLVGALSIVRFRTAIKDPEELIYLFISIAIGLGLGADQRIPTLSAIAFILLYLLARTQLWKKHRVTNNLYLNIHIPVEQTETQVFTQVNELLFQFSSELELHRLDSEPQSAHIVYLLNLSNQQEVSQLIDTLRTHYPESSISFVEQKI